MNKQLKRSLPISLFLAFILAMFQGCTSNGTGTTAAVSYPLRGTVTDSTTHTPIYPATIGVGSQSVTTSSDGSFSFSYQKVKSGTYTMMVSASGYDSLSRQITVMSDTTVTINLSLQALKKRINIEATLLQDSSIARTFSFDDYPFVQCAGGLVDHSVKVEVHIDTASHPVSVIVVGPDGSYVLDKTDADTSWVGELTSDLCGTWTVMVSDSGDAPVNFAGYLQLDFSDYPASGNGISSNIIVPVDYASIPHGDTASFSRYLRSEMTYQLRLSISGGTGNDIVLEVLGKNSPPIFAKRIDGTYISQTFLAPQAGFYKFVFINDSRDTSTRSVVGVLSIGS